jgi:hypothetical protein
MTPSVAGAALLAAIFAGGCASSPSPAPAASDSASAAALIGEWGIQIKLMEHTVDGTLRFTREGKAVLGSFADHEGNQSELEKLHVADGKISWEMDRRDGRLVAKGTINGTIISGKMKLHRGRDAADTGFGVSGGAPAGGRRVGEPDWFAFTAVKRAEDSTAPPHP